MESYRMKSGYKAVRNDSQDEDDPMGLGLLISYILQQFIYPLHQQIAILWDTHVFPFSRVLGGGYQKTVLFSTNDMNFLRFMCQVSCKFCLQMILIRRSATSGRQKSTATSVAYASMKRPKYIPNTRASHGEQFHQPCYEMSFTGLKSQHMLPMPQKSRNAQKLEALPVVFSHPLFEGADHHVQNNLIQTAGVHLNMACVENKLSSEDVHQQSWSSLKSRYNSQQPKKNKMKPDET